MSKLSRRSSSKTKKNIKINNESNLTKCSGWFKCSQPNICNLCYDQHKNTEFNGIKFKPYVDRDVIMCFNCFQPTFYRSTKKISKKYIRELRASKPIEIDELSINRKCSYSNCNEKSSLSKWCEICHKCIFKMKNLIVNNGRQIGRCDTCMFPVMNSLFHKKCYTKFMDDNNITE